MRSRLGFIRGGSSHRCTCIAAYTRVRTDRSQRALWRLSGSSESASCSDLRSVRIGDLSSLFKLVLDKQFVWLAGVVSSVSISDRLVVFWGGVVTLMYLMLPDEEVKRLRRLGL